MCMCGHVEGVCGSVFWVSDVWERGSVEGEVMWVWLWEEGVYGCRCVKGISCIPYSGYFLRG